MQPISAANSRIIQPSRSQEKEYTFVKVEEVPESFLATHYPENRLNYWKQICEAHCQLTLQLDMDGVDYHLKKNEPFSYHPWRIDLKSEEAVADGVFCRHYLLYNTVTGEKRTHEHLNLFWPDSGTPSAANFLALYRRYNDLINHTTPRVMIHCRAGKGRTGCFIFTRCLIFNIRMQPNDVYLKIHTQHPIMLTDQQYVFAEKAAGLLAENSSTELHLRLLSSFQQEYAQAIITPYPGSEDDTPEVQIRKATISERVHLVLTKVMDWLANR